jgi:CRP-like cAMP-binding protein
MRRRRRADDDWPYNLRRLSLFRDCPDEELHDICNLFTWVRLRPGSVLIREDRPGMEFVVIADGSVGVTRGQLHCTKVLSVLGPGDFVGEMALLDGTLRSATVTAITTVSLFVATPGEFHVLLQRSPSVEQKVTRADLERGATNLLDVA